MSDIKPARDNFDRDIDQVAVAWSWQSAPLDDESIVVQGPNQALSDACERVKFLESEVARLLSGDWTEEEIQQLIKLSDE